MNESIKNMLERSKRPQPTKKTLFHRKLWM